ncbi:MAG TPA: asparagine synthase (glutamine-hydrolyzing) [Rugosimonospora sp.]|nr:asparagine synthase (glutamine-hydrolyzing) [Rugosimonospora sp.]
MGGIAGWVDYHRDLGRDGGVVRGMIARLAHRGHEAESLWVGTRAVLAHRQLAVGEPRNARRPALATDGGQVLAVLAYDGEIYNHAALRTELTARGHRFRERGDTEVALRAYLEWGMDCASHLDGMFAFAVWDARQQALVLVRDRLGIKPLYYCRTATGVLFASEPKAILAHPLVPATVDEDGLREALAFTGTPGRTVFRDIQKVLAGTVLRIDRHGTTQNRYWALTGQPHTDDRAKTVEVVRGLLEEAVGKQLAIPVPFGAFLSGGLDSSSMVALAARILRERGNQQLRTYSLCLAAESENLAPDPVRSSFDAPYAREVAAHVGAEHTEVVLETGHLKDPVIRAALVPAQHDTPYSISEAHTTLYVLCRAVAEHASVALMGEWADTLFGAFLGIEDPGVVAARTLPWVAFTSKHTVETGLGTGLFDRQLLKRLDLPGYCADRYADALAEVPYVDGESPAERRMREICYLHLQGWREVGVATDDGIGMANGLELRVPYFDHHLVQYVFNTPWAYKTFDGRSKSLLRAAMADLLPASVLERRPSPFPITHDPAYSQFLREALAGVASDPQSPILPLLDVDAVRRLVEDPAAFAGGWRTRTDVEMVLQTNAWLDRCRVHLAL